MSLTTELKQEVQELIAAGDKPGAIAFLRQRLNIDVSEATTLADAAEIELRLEQQSLQSPAEAPELSAELTAQVKSLLGVDRKIEAINLVRDNLGVSLQEALMRVEAIESLTDPRFRPGSLPGSRKDTFGIVGKIFAGIGIFMTCIALYIFYLKQNTISTSDKGIGYVTDMVYSSGGSTAPKIAYEWNGGRHVYQSNVYTTPPAYEIGEEVRLYINRQDPTDVVIDSFTGRWVAVLIVGGLGIFFFAFGTLFIFVSAKF